MMSNLQPAYYAVPDPDTGEMTYWRRDKRGQLNPWPQRPQAFYGPRLRGEPIPHPGPHDHVIPPGLNGEARQAWHREWVHTVARPWRANIEEAIDTDPERALARFAVFGSRCVVCSKVLDDAESKVLGIGPVCRKGLPSGLVQAIAREVSRMHGEQDLGKQVNMD